MSDCRRTVEQLAPYVEGALSPGDRAGVDRHLEACPPCRRMAEAVAGGRTVLRRCAGALQEEALPPGLRSRCEALARDRQPDGSRAWVRRLATAFAIAVLLVGTTFTLFAFATSHSDLLLAQQLTIDHAKCFRLFASPDARAADAAQTEAMLHGKYGWNVHVPPTSIAEGLTLIGARRCLYAAGAIPHVMYRMGADDVSLYVLDGVNRHGADITTLGHRSRIWSHGNTTYVLVGARGGADFDRAARYIMQQAP
jgi:anti-sigma factor RsiW